MYKKGDLIKTSKPCKDFEAEEFKPDICMSCPEGSERHIIQDARGKEDIEHPAVGLPHSCQEWAIGGVEEAKALIKDLQEWIKEQEDIY